MSSENGIDYAKEIWLGQADDYEGNPEDIEGNGSVLWSQANNFEANGQRYVRADIHDTLRNRVAELENEDAFFDELLAQDKTIASLRAQLSNLTRERPMSELLGEPLKETTPFLMNFKDHEMYGTQTMVMYYIWSGSHNDDTNDCFGTKDRNIQAMSSEIHHWLPLPATGGTET